MPANDPLQRAYDLALSILGGVVPKAQDGIAKAPAPKPRFSLETVAAMPPDVAEPFLQAQIDRHGEGAVEEHVRRQATAGLRKRGWL
jgi:hypothetical protein